MNSILKVEIEKSLTGKFGEKVEISTSSHLGGGCINNASQIHTNIGSFFLKWNSDSYSDLFLKEEEGLIELKKATNSNLIVPSVYASKSIDSSPGFLIQEFLLAGYSSETNEEKLGRGLANIHKYKSNKYGFYNDNYCGATPQKNTWCDNWIEFFREHRLKYLLDLIERDRPLPVSERNTYTKLLDRIPRLIDNQCVPSLIHGDLWSGNYMFTKNGPALIDPAAYYANREMEMAIVTMFGGFSSRFYAAYNEIYPLDPDWRQRNKLYQLYHILNHYYLFGGAYGSNALSVAKSYL